VRLIAGNDTNGPGVELISIHIPKTGGRSFHEVLKKVYGSSLDRRYEKEHFFPSKGVEGILGPDLPGGIRGIHGHLTIAQVMDIISRHRPRVITWVRNPVDRVISNYYYFMKRIREGDTPEKQKKKSAYSLLDYASQPKRRNRMSWILEGLDLKDFFFIGIMERFEEDLKLLGSMMDWPPDLEVPHINDSSSFKLNNDCTTQFKDIDEKMLKEVAMLNKEDMALYKSVFKMRGIHGPVE
jgi:hypothetical protein